MLLPPEKIATLAQTRDLRAGLIVLFQPRNRRAVLSPDLIPFAREGGNKNQILMVTIGFRRYLFQTALTGERRWYAKADLAGMPGHQRNIKGRYPAHLPEDVVRTREDIQWRCRRREHNIFMNQDIDILHRRAPPYCSLQKSLRQDMAQNHPLNVFSAPRPHKRVGPY
tara:strand:- start:237 stop:740 length:504 start_codon:yes stop_codon:yes gene_type:complete